MKWKPYSESDGIDELRKLVDHYYSACVEMNSDIVSMVAPVLGYEYSREYGWNVGDHTCESLVLELARKYNSMNQMPCDPINEKIIAEATIEAENALLPLLGYEKNDAGEWRGGGGEFPRVGGLVNMIKLLGKICQYRDRMMGLYLTDQPPTSPPVP